MPIKETLGRALSLAAASLQQITFGLRERLVSVRFHMPRSRSEVKKLIPLALLGFVVLAVLIRAAMTIRSSMQPQDTRVSLKAARASIVLNKAFSFPLKDANGKEITKIAYVVESADLRDELIVKGQRAIAVKGRTFLVLTIKIANDYNKGLEMNVRDYIRLTTNNNEQERLAADIHNDPVTVQPISTKYTRIGFPINDTDTNLVLYVGELNGNKESITLSFP